jgi:membrane-bound serine protease (ClpP class)
LPSGKPQEGAVDEALDGGGKPPDKPSALPSGARPPAEQSSVLMQKITNDVTAYLRAIAERRGRNAQTATLAVTESKSWTDKEALDANLIDLVATSDIELLSKLHNREVKLLDGTVRTLSVQDQPVTTIEMTFREKALSFLVNPNLAFLLLLVGALLIYVEVTHAGMILPGVIGGLCLLLAVTGFSFLPVTASGVLLILAAIGLFVAEVFVTSFGLLALLGAVALAIGGIMLVDVPEQEFGVDPILAIAAALAFGAITVFLGTIVLKALRRETTTGSEGMIGKEGTAVTLVEADGKVLLNGEYWNASADTPILPGTAVRCIAISGLKVKVTPVEPAQVQISG